MISFKNITPSAAFTVLPIDPTQAGTLKGEFKNGFCEVEAAGNKTLAANFTSAPVDVVALLGVSAAVKIAAYRTLIDNNGTIDSTQEIDPARASTQSIIAINTARASLTDVEITFKDATDDSYLRQLWIGAGIRLRPNLTMLRTAAGGSEIVQHSSGVVTRNERPSWRVFNAAFNGVGDTDWLGEYGFEALEAIGEGAELLMIPSTSLATNLQGRLAVHGYMTGFRATQKRRGLRGVEFTVTECR